jgi:hypothetical protein
MRPFDFTIPSGIVRPRRRAIRVSTADRTCAAGFCCAGWACAAEMSRLPLDSPKAHTAMDRAPEMRTTAGRTALSGRADIRDLLRTVPLPKFHPARDTSKLASGQSIRHKPTSGQRQQVGHPEHQLACYPSRPCSVPGLLESARHAVPGGDGSIARAACTQRSRRCSMGPDG